MLNRAKLEADLLQICRNPTDSYKVAADKFARAYAKYIKDGTANGVPPNPALIPGAETTLAGTLAVAYKTSRTYPDYASKVTSAIGLFWALFLSPAGFSGSLSTTVVTPPLQAALNAMLASNTAIISGGGTITEQQAATKMASVLHTFTKTIIVTFPGTPPVPFPFV
jgi:hypothetical protein